MTQTRSGPYQVPRGDQREMLEAPCSPPAQLPPHILLPAMLLPSHSAPQFPTYLFNPPTWNKREKQKR